jgi:hypothetical protein
LRCLVASLLLLGLMNPLPSGAGVTAQCVTERQVMELLARNVSTNDLIHLRNADAQAFLIAFNNLPPRSNHTADTFVIVTSERLPQHLVFAFRQGCLVGRAGIDPRVSTRILSDILGQGV